MSKRLLVLTAAFIVAVAYASPTLADGPRNAVGNHDGFRDGGRDHRPINRAEHREFRFDHRAEHREVRFDHHDFARHSLGHR
jgi:hypothetical protein